MGKIKALFKKFTTPKPSPKALTAIRRLCKYGVCGVWLMSALPLLMVIIGLEARLLTGPETPFPLLTLFATEGMVIVTGVIGYALSSALDDLNRRFSWIRNIIIALACLTIWMLSLYLPFTLLLRIGLGVCLIVAFYMGSGFYYSSYEDILSPQKFRGIIIFHLAVVFLMWIGRLPEVTIILALEIILAAAIHTVSENQINLEHMMERRHQTFSRLPNRIRSHNLRLTLIGLGVTCVFFLFSKWIMAGLWWLIKAIVMAIAVILQVLQWLMDFLMRTVASEGPRPTRGESGPIFPVGPTTEENKVVSFLLIAALIVLALIYFGKPLWRAFCRFVDWISNGIRNWVFQLLTKQDFTDGANDFIDHEERVSKEGSLVKTGRAGRKSAWLQGYRAFKKQRDPLTKYREGYRLIESWSALHGKPVALPDTVTERLEHMENAVPQKGAIARDYCCVKYGSPKPEAPDLALLEAALADLSKHMPTKKALKRRKLAQKI